MAQPAGVGGDDGVPAPEGGLPQHPYVERLKPDPSQPARRVVDLTGLPGNSDRPGYQRLYLTTRLNYYAEFLASDMVYSEAVPADQSPFPGQEATRVSVSRDATIHYVWARSPQPVDEFDLDVRLGAPAAAAAAPALPPSPPDCQTVPHTCVCPTPACTGATCHTRCNQNTCAATCPATCAGGTCHAANTCQGHGTCVPTQCLEAACIFTQNNAGTCVTCVFTACNQGTCANTACQQLTCVTCVVPGNTCAATCVV
jgi:hypothetical protein